MRQKRERDSRDAPPEREASTARISPSTSFGAAPAACVTRERIVEEEDNMLCSVTDKEIASALTEFADIVGFEGLEGSGGCGTLRETSSAHSSTSTLRSSSSASSRLLRRSRSSTVSFDTPELPHRTLVAPALSAPASPSDAQRPSASMVFSRHAPPESPSSSYRYSSSAPLRVPVVPAFNEAEDQGDGWGWYV